MKKLLLIGLALGALVIVAVLVVPPFIDLGAYKARFLPLVEESLQRKVDVGEVRFRILPAPAIRITALNVSDNPAFSKDPFFTAQQIKLQLKFWPLLRGEFRVDEFILEKPAISLRKQPDGTFNFADLAKKKDAVKKKEVSPKKQGPAKFSELIPARLRIQGGEVTLQTKGQKALAIGGVDVLLEDFSAERPFLYRISLNPPGLKTITLGGRLSYEESQTTLKLMESHLKAQDLDFAVNGAVTELSGVPKVNLTLANEGFETKPIFQLFSAAGFTPKELEVSGQMGLQVALIGPSHSLAAAVAAHLKELKVNDRRAFDGTLVGEILLSLPLGGEAPITHTLSGNGKLVAKDGKLTSVDLISKIQLLTGLIGLPKEQTSGATTFKTLEAQFGLGGGIAEIQRLFLSNPLMEALGGGKIGLASLSSDVGLEVALAPEVSGRAGSGRAATFFKDSQGRIVVPLKITGPVGNPSVSLDASKVVKKGIGQLFERFFKAR
ncbi:MAG: AsmA family protein [Deltaproteobacteria bacterium]|nr:AsmA family protein [Deltaproteobacteria bacterium]